MAQRTLPWQPILGSMSAISADSFSIVALVFQNGLEYRRCDLQRFISDDMATLFVNLVVNFGAVTPEFKIGKGVHPVVSFFQTNYLRKHQTDLHQIFTTW